MRLKLEHTDERLTSHTGLILINPFKEGSASLRTRKESAGQVSPPRGGIKRPHVKY